jgi:hypothetical protein
MVVPQQYSNSNYSVNVQVDEFAALNETRMICFRNWEDLCVVCCH